MAHSHEKFEASHVREHFDEIAPGYDALKKRNSYYYENLQAFIAELIPPGRRVLDIGTGTGEILNRLAPSRGAGIDLSPKMIEAARKKFPRLEFRACSIEDFKSDEEFDFVLLADVIEHLSSPYDLFVHLKRIARPSTQIVLTMANPLWEPLLEVLEKLHLKMEEGPHHRITPAELVESAQKTGFRLVSKDAYLLFPLGLPLISGFFNRFIGRLPGIRRLNLIQRYVFQTSAA